MHRFATLIIAVALLIGGCHGSEPADLLETTTFELARDHGRYVRVDRLNLFAITLGEGPDLILLHGNPASTYSWRFVIEPLAEDFRVHAFDLPGFGFSDKPANAVYTAAWFAKIIDGYMRAEGIDKAIVVGNSMGGEVATEFAALYASKVRALVLLAPSGLQGEAAPEQLPFALRAARWPVIGPIIAALPIRPMIASGLRDGFYDPSIVSEADVDAMYLPLRTENRMVAFFARLGQPVSVRRADLLGLVRAPTLIIVGDSDRILSPEISRWHHEVIRNSELLEWEYTGHLPQEEHPDRVVEEIRRFAADNPVR
jgi:pimeloyl-ACP methyl ester carboxylesterase